MLQISNNHQIVKDAAMAATTGESTACRLLYQGTSTFNHGRDPPIRLMGCGHHGPDYAGVAAVRNGKQYANTSLPAITTINTGDMNVRQVV